MKKTIITFSLALASLFGYSNNVKSNDAIHIENRNYLSTKSSLNLKKEISEIEKTLAESPNLLVCDPIIASLVGSTSVSCNGGNNGSATVTASSGTNTVSYFWQPFGGFSSTINNVAAGSYTCNITNSCGNQTVVVVSITEPSPLNISITSSHSVICNGESATLTANGATSYTWSDGSMGSSIIVSPTTPSSYSVIGVNALGCSNTFSITLNALITPTVNITPPSATLCPGSNIMLTASGATTYTWSSGFPGQNNFVTPTVTTVYTATSTNVCGTSVGTTTVYISNTPAVVAVASKTAICIGEFVTINAYGATSYTWLPSGNNGQTLFDNPTSNTTYTLIGNSSCGTASTTISIIASNPITVSVTASNYNICAGQSTTLTAGGFGVINYNWSNGVITANTIVSPSVTTTYTVTGNNGAGCTDTKMITINVNNITPTISITPTNTTICAGSSVMLNASTNSGIIWSDGFVGMNNVVTPTITTIYSASTTVGCGISVATTTVFVNSTNITVSATNTNICLGQQTTLTASGATSYTFMPVNQMPTNIAIVSPTTTTSYTVYGSSTCGTGSTIVTVNVSALNLVTNTTNTTICLGQSATLIASGAATYTWSNGINVSSIVVSPSLATTYTVWGTNGFGCTDMKIISVNIITPASITVSPASTTVCPNSNILISASGATNYLWNTGFTGANLAITATASAVYTVSTTNLCGTSFATSNVVVSTSPVITASANPASICLGQSSTLTGFGGTSYTFTPGNSSVVSPTTTTTYTVFGISNCGSGSGIVTVSVSSMTFNTASNNANFCTGQSATLIANGASSYNWSTGATTSNIVVSPSVATVYSVTGTTGACVETQTLFVSPIITPSISISVVNTTICPNANIILNATSTGNYLWNTGFTGANLAVSPSVTTIYTVTSSNSCGSATATATVIVSNIVSVQASTSNSILCVGQSATLSANGASSYTWMPGSISANSIVVSPTVTTTYTLNGTASCGSAQTLFIQTVSICTDLANNISTTGSLQIYPNPAYNNVTIVLNNITDNVTIELVNTLGEVVIKENITNTSVLNIENLKTGVYFIRIDNQVKNKLIKN